MLNSLTEFGLTVLALFLAPIGDDAKDSLCAKLQTEWQSISIAEPRYLSLQLKSTQSTKVIQDSHLIISRGPNDRALVLIEHSNGEKELLCMNHRYAFQLEKQGDSIWKLKHSENRPAPNIIAKIEEYLQSSHRQLSRDRVGAFQLLDFLDPNRCVVQDTKNNGNNGTTLQIMTLPDKSGEYLERMRSIQLELMPSKPYFPRKASITHRFHDGREYQVDMEFGHGLDSNENYRAEFRSHAHGLGLDDTIEVKVNELRSDGVSEAEYFLHHYDIVEPFHLR